MKSINRSIAFIFFLLAGIVIGTVVGKLCAGVSFLSFLAYTVNVGLPAETAVIDLIVCKITFGFELSVNAAQILCVIAALVLFNKTCKGV